MADKIIEIRNLSKSYGSFRAIDQLNLDVFRGDVYGFLGPNGAGKSTTIRMMLTLIRPDSGEINMFGRSLFSNRNYILSRTGSIVEKPDFYKFLSARKNIELLAKLSGVRLKKNKTEEIFELVGLKGREDDKAKTYSHGMRQRLGLAQALIHDPELIILDEPATGLDPQGIIDIRNLVNHLSKDLKKTILLSSHILSEIELIATRMVIINNGKAVAEGNVTELLNASDLVVSFSVNQTEKAKYLISNSKWNTKFQEPFTDQIVLHIAKEEIASVNKFLCENNIEVNGIESKKKLEDYFLQLVSKNQNA
jgi:ABC-type multidrug transport system ATPase subunit